MEDMDGKNVMPGDEIAIAEEFGPGPNTFEKEGKLRSSIMGTVKLDLNERMASVIPHNPIVEIRPGDVVIGIVTGYRKAMAVIDIIKVVGKDRQMLPVQGDGAIHVSKVSHDYIEDITKEFQLTDIVRAKVLEVKPHIQLTTEEEDYGVLKSVCEQCGRTLRRKTHKLYCNECDKFFYRKTAVDYGSGEESPAY